MKSRLFYPINFTLLLLVPLHVILMTFLILAVTGNHLPLAHKQSRSHVSFGRCGSSECIFFLPSINHIICSRTFVKQDEPLREMDALTFYYWHFT